MVANASMVYRIGANLDDLRKNLAEGKAIIETVNADVKKLSGGAAPGVRRVRDEIDAAVKPTNEWHKSFQAVDSALAALGINIGTDVKAMDELATATRTGGAGMNDFAKAGLIAAAAIGGWKIGEKISEWTGWGDRISEVTAKLLGFGDVAGERAAAGADTLAKASKLVGFQLTDMDTAIKVLTADVQDHAAATNTSANRIAGWRQEIAKVKSDGNWSKLTADITSQNFSLDELGKRYGITVDAMQFFTREQKNADDAIAESNQRMLENLKNSIAAQKEQREKADDLASAYAHVSLAQGHYSEVLSQFDATLVENVKHWTDLGATAADVAVILDQPAGKIDIITQALKTQADAFTDLDQKMQEFAAKQNKLYDELIAKRDAANQADEDLKKRIAGDGGAGTTPTSPTTPPTPAAPKPPTVYSHTYDLSTSDGLAEFHRLNPAAQFYGAAAENPLLYFRTHTLEDAVRAGLLNFYAGYIGQFAEGVRNFSGGMALVGERGPEIVNLPRGVDVIPNHEIAGAIGGMSITVGDIYVSGAIVGSQAELGRVIGQAVMAHLRSTGAQFPVTRKA